MGGRKQMHLSRERGMLLSWDPGLCSGLELVLWNQTPLPGSDPGSAHGCDLEEVTLPL